MSRQRPPLAGQQAVSPVTLRALVTTLRQRCRIGEAAYGRALETWNGRDAGRDAWEELVDLAQYLTQLRLEHRDLVAEVTRLQRALDRCWCSRQQEGGTRD